MSKDRTEIIQDRFEDNSIEDKSVEVQVCLFSLCSNEEGNFQ